MALRISQFIAEVGVPTGSTTPPRVPGPTRTMRLSGPGEGIGNTWFIALQLSDSGIELRDKVFKPVRFRGKTTQGRIKVYGYGPKEDVDVEDIERGVNQKATLLIPDTTKVQFTKALKVNVKNVMVHTIRIEGIWDGDNIPDRVDEAVYEIARQGVRR